MCLNVYTMNSTTKEIKKTCTLIYTLFFKALDNNSIYKLLKLLVFQQKQ